MDIQFPVYAGLIAAMLHVITGPDHLAAVTPFAIESKKKAWQNGLFWGIGHLAGMLSIGLLFIVFKDFIPIESISHYSEELVGIVLIAVGAWSIFRIFKTNKTHKHLHIHSDNAPVIHKHSHEHTHENNHSHVHKKEQKQSNFASFSIGFLHGLAGIAHFILFLPVLGFENQADSFLYIFGFGLGTLIAMTSYGFVIGNVSAIAKNEHNDVFFKGVRLAGGLFAIIIGFYWLLAN